MNDKPKSYLRQLAEFYFAPVWPSFFTILYLLFFAYFTVFYAGHLIVAFKFLLYTLRHSTLLLGLSYLFWGVVFVIALIVPFSVSVYAVFLAYEIWKSRWETRQKYMAIMLIVLIVPLVVVVMDYLIRAVERQEAMRDFVAANNLSLTGALPAR